MKITCTSTSLNDSIPLTERSLQKRGKNRYRILYSEVNTAPDADVWEMFDNFQAEISVSNPYDDAEYAWAIIKKGEIRIIKDGKVVAKEFYFNADDEDLENEEWCDSVINRALDALEKVNSKIESRTIHSSEEVGTNSELDGFEYAGTRNGWFFYRKLVNGKGKWKALDVYKFDEKDFAENAIDITYNQALGYEPLPARNQTEALSRKLGELLLPNSSITGAADMIDGYWFFTKHGVQPGSIPKDVEILDIVDTARGTFVKFNRFLSTKELNYYDIIEKAPEGITSAESTKISWNDMELVDQLAAIQNYVKEYEGTRVFEDFAEYVNKDVSDVIDLFSDMESRNMIYIPYNIQKDSEFANDDIYSNKEITASDEHVKDDDVYEDDDIYSSKESDIIPKLREDLKTAVNEMMISDEFGFSENEAEQYSAVDVYRKDDNIVCEIRAEVSFEGLMDLCEKCNPIVEKYCNNTYFDPEEPGIATAYIPVSSVTGAITAMEDSMLEPPEPKEYDEITEEFEIEVDLSGVVIRIEDESWDYEDDSYEFAANEDGKDYRSEYGVYVDDTTGVVEKIDELIEKDIPIGTGRYELSGYAYLVYDITGIDSDKDYYPDGDYEEEIYTDNAKAEFNFEKSYVKDFQIKKL